MKLKLYFKNGLGFHFYFSIILAIAVCASGLYQIQIKSNIPMASIDFVLAILLSFMAISRYKHREGLVSQEIKVEKYEVM